MRHLPALILFLVLALFGSTSFAVANHNQSAVILVVKPMVIGHNGGMGIAPEDTVLGITRTSQAGAPMIDVDVRWSANNNTQANPGYPVLMHDETVDRTTNGTGKPSELSLTYLTSLLAQDYAPWKTDPQYAGVKVPYAWEFFDASRDTGIVLQLDVKEVPTEWEAKKLIEYADKFIGGRDRLVYMSSAASISAMRTWFPDLVYTMIEYPPNGVMRTGEYLNSIGASTYAIPSANITPALVTYYHSYGISVGTWTTDSNGIYDNSANWQKVTNAGVDSVTTNRVADYLNWTPIP